MLRTISKTFLSAMKIVYRENCSAMIAETAQQIAKVAGLTLGPMGRNVMIENGDKDPRITKDGVTVEDRLKDAVCTLIKKSVNATNKFAGDGTTTSTLLIGEIMKQGRKMLESGTKVKEIKDGLLIGRNIGIDFIKTASRPIATVNFHQKIAMISTKNDIHLSKIISQAVSKCEIIKIEKSYNQQSYLQYHSGVKMVAGIPHPEFKNKGDKVELNYPLVVLDKKGIKKIEQVVGILQLAKKARKPILIISTDISDSVMSTLIYNIRKNIVQAYPLILREYGTISSEYFKQISKLTEATIFDTYGPCNIQQIEFKHLGKAVKVEMDMIESSIIGKAKEESKSAVIYTGGQTQAIGLEIYDKVVDALNSVQTAKKHGVVAGGGVTYWRLADLLDRYSGQGQAGVRLLGRALRSPRRRLVESLQQESFQALRGEGWQGYNFKTQKLEDMFDAGVIDSAIVGQSVLIDSVSLAHLLLDIDVCIVRDSLNKYDSAIEGIEEKYKL